MPPKKPTPADKFAKIKSDIAKGKSAKQAVREALEKARKAKKS